jgi:signal transduction histidine kinase
MSLVTVLWSMGAAAALTLAVLYGAAWWSERRNLGNLMFCLTAVAVAGIARAEVGMLHATTVAAFGEWARWYHLPLFLAIVGQLLFVRYYLGTGRAWLLRTIVLARLVVLVGNFLVDPNFNWREIISLQQVSLLGEPVSVVGEAVLRSWQWLPAASWVLMVVFVADAAVQRWRQGGPEARRRALVVGAAIGAPLAVFVVAGQIMVLGFAHLPVLNTPSFLVMLGVMAFELSRGVLVNRGALQELEELRGELARAGRVSTLGQLASALAHELSQPLGAILRNAEAAELLLRKATPDLEELRAIVADIRKDDSRAGEVIDRMRALIKRGSVDLKPLALAELVQDVFLLVHSDARARHVVLDSAVAPELPLVAGDRVHLSQVLLNLIINGMDAMEACQASARHLVIAARSAAPRTVEVAVTDSGRGIPAEMVDKVFEPFFTTKAGGMGMGLPVSRTIIEAHGGRLWAEQNADRRGLTFRFTLQQAAVTAP